MLKDSEWGAIDGELCRVIRFTPMASIQDGKVRALNMVTPYAAVILERAKTSEPIEGFIAHKMDFKHLWAAFKERGVGQDEEVIVGWSKKHLKGYARVLSAFTPKLWVMICPKGAFELMTNLQNRPDLHGEARFLAERPIVEWKPEVMK